MALEFLKLASISGLVFIAATFIILIAAGYLYRDKIKTLFIESLNQRLKTELFVKEVKLELTRAFPLASLTFYDITIMGTDNGNPQDTLLFAKKLQLQFDILDIIRKKYTLKQITANKGTISPGYNEEGVSNFQFWDTTTENSQDNFHFDLKKFVLNNMHIRFHHKKLDHLTDFYIIKATLGGQFNRNLYELSASGDIYAYEIAIDSIGLIREKPVRLDLALQVTNNAVFHFKKGNISVNEHQFSVTGDMTRINDGVDFQTRVEGKKLTIQDLLNDLPDVLKNHTAAYRAKGRLDFIMDITGNFAHNEYPVINASFSLKQGEIYHQTTNLQLKELSFEGNYNNGALRIAETNILTISDIRTTINDGSIKGSVRVENFLEPYLSLNISSDMSTPDMAKLLRFDTVSSSTGRVLMDISFQGGMSEKNRFTGQDLVKARASGNISAKNVGFTLKNSPHTYHGLNGDLLFKNNDLLVEGFSGNISQSDFIISGYFRNVLPYLFLDGESIQIDASLYSKHLNFDELLQTSNSDTESTYKLTFSDRLGFNLLANIDELNFRRFQASDISGNVSLQNKRFNADNVRFRSMNGHVNATGYIDGTRTDRLTMVCSTGLKGVDVHQLFYQMGNFGQKEILDENIFGIMTSEFQFFSQWSPSLEIDWNSLQTNASIRIEDGVLVNYEPMNALGRFLRVEDLSRVRFSTLENNIHIKDRMMIIPDMEINSNIMNLKLSGKHSFENQIEYHLQILLSEILAEKNRQRRNPQEQYGDIIDDGLGRTTLFLKVTGHISDPVFRYDYQGVRQKLVNDMRQERESLLEALKKELQLFSGSKDEQKAPAPITEKQKEMQQLRKQEEGKMIFEWEEF